MFSVRSDLYIPPDTLNPPCIDDPYWQGEETPRPVLISAVSIVQSARRSGANREVHYSPHAADLVLFDCIHHLDRYIDSRISTDSRGNSKGLKRPRAGFFFFRSATYRTAGTGSARTQDQFSAQIGDSWNQIDEERKRPFNARQKREKALYRAFWPNYSYNSTSEAQATRAPGGNFAPRSVRTEGFAKQPSPSHTADDDSDMDVDSDSKPMYHDGPKTRSRANPPPPRQVMSAPKQPRIKMRAVSRPRPIMVRSILCSLFLVLPLPNLSLSLCRSVATTIAQTSSPLNPSTLANSPLSPNSVKSTSLRSTAILRSMMKRSTMTLCMTPATVLNQDILFSGLL
jgi:hypothetical protein